MAAYVTPPAPRRRRRKVAALVVGCVALAGGGVFAITTIAGGSAEGGAASPEQAVEELVAAANQEDVLGVLDVVLPSERRTWGEPLEQMFAEAKRLEVLASAADLGQIRGVDLAFDITPGRPENLAVDIAIVPVTGKVSATVDLSALPIGKLLLDHGVDLGGEDPPRDTHRIDGRVATVERGGRWYVSLGYTAAEAVRMRGEGLTWPAPDRGLEPIGAGDAVGAVSEMLSAIEDLSLEEVIRAIDPGEAEVLQRVASWYMEDAQAQIDAAVAAEGITLRFTDRVLSLQRQDGDTALVGIDRLGMEFEFQGARVRYEDGCISVTPPRGQETTQCPAKGTSTEETLGTQLDTFGLGRLSETLTKAGTDIAAALEDLGDQGIVAHRVGGLWYTSPIGTSFELVLSVMRALDRGELDTIIGDLSGVAAAFEDLIGEAIGDGFSDSSTDMDSDGSSDDSADPVTDDPIDQYFECEAEPTFDAALACVNAGLATGRFTRDLVSGIYLVPECAWRAIKYDPGLLTLPDAEYVERATLSAACFEGKIAAGVITRNHLPFELIEVQCLKGKNPANMTPKEASDYFACQLEDE